MMKKFLEAVDFQELLFVLVLDAKEGRKSYT
jgi:hypothetical protein